MSTGIEMMKSEPRLHLNVVTDLYRILFDGLYFMFINMMVAILWM